MEMMSAAIENNKTIIKCNSGCEVKLAGEIPDFSKLPIIEKQTNGYDVANTVLTNLTDIGKSVTAVYFPWKYGSRILEKAINNSGSTFVNSNNTNTKSSYDNDVSNVEINRDVNNNKSINLNDVDNDKHTDLTKTIETDNNFYIS